MSYKTAPNFYNKHTLVSFANGTFIYAKDAERVPCIAATDAEHGDWKTATMRGIKGIRKGQQCYLITMFDNYYGQWATIEVEGRTIDVKPSELIFNATTEFYHE